MADTEEVSKATTDLRYRIRDILEVAYEHGSESPMNDLFWLMTFYKNNRPQAFRLLVIAQKSALENLGRDCPDLDGEQLDLYNEGKEL